MREKSKKCVLWAQKFPPVNPGRREGRGMMEEGRGMRPDAIRHNHQEEPASDAGERKKRKAAGRFASQLLRERIAG